MKKGCSRFAIFGLLIFAVLAFVWSVLNYSGAPGEGQAIIPISPETTIVASPLNLDGDVDHVAHLNQTFGEGVTPENNAAVAILRIVGPQEIPVDLRAEIFARLGIESIPIEGNYYREYFDYLQELKKTEEIDDRQYKVLDLQNDFAGSNPWTARDVPDVAAWHDVHAGNIEAMRRATENSRFFVPLLDGTSRPCLINTLLPVTQSCRTLTRALNKNSKRNLGKGDIDECFADTMAIRKLARLIAQGPTLVEQLVAIAIEGVGIRAEIDAAGSGLATQDQLRAYRDAVAMLPPLDNMADRIDTTERMAFVNMLTVIARDGSSKASLLFGESQEEGVARTFYDSVLRGSTDWGAAARVGNYWYDKVADAYRIEDYEKRGEALNEINLQLQSDHKSIGVGSAIGAFLGGRKGKGRLTGRVMVALMLPAFGAANQTEIRTAASDRLMQICFSLEMYKLDRDEYPETLEPLVPDYINELPVDPHISKSFVYKKIEDSYLLYSVGPNLIDDGGRTYDEDGDDERIEYQHETWEEFIARRKAEDPSLFPGDRNSYENPELDAPEPASPESTVTDAEAQTQNSN